MPDSVRPRRWQPTRLPCPWDSPGKNTGVGCHFLLQCMKVKSESKVAQLCLTLATPWTAAYQAPLSMGFSRQKYWSGMPLPSPVTSLVLNYFINGSLCLFSGSLCLSPTLQDCPLPLLSASGNHKSDLLCSKLFFIFWFSHISEITHTQNLSSSVMYFT